MQIERYLIIVDHYQNVLEIVIFDPELSSNCLLLVSIILTDTMIVNVTRVLKRSVRTALTVGYSP